MWFITRLLYLQIPTENNQNHRRYSSREIRNNARLLPTGSWNVNKKEPSQNPPIFCGTWKLMVRFRSIFEFHTGHPNERTTLTTDQKCSLIFFIPPKGQLISKGVLMSLISSKKRMKEFDFTTMIPQIDLFSFVFCRTSKTSKPLSKVTDL